MSAESSWPGMGGSVAHKGGFSPLSAPRASAALSSPGFACARLSLPLSPLPWHKGQMAPKFRGEETRLSVAHPAVAPALTLMLVADSLRLEPAADSSPSPSSQLLGRCLWKA